MPHSFYGSALSVGSSAETGLEDKTSALTLCSVIGGDIADSVSGDTESLLSAAHHTRGSNTTAASHTATATNPKSRHKAISFLGALLLPGVIPYSLAFAFLKMVNYVFFFWLPFYLSSTYGWPESAADRLSIWYDVGGVVGATVAGALGNRFQKRALVLTCMLVAGVPMLYVYGSPGAGRDMTVNAAMLVCLGGLIGGVANIISAAVSADLGRQDSIRGDKEAMATVAGIIEGTGTMGAALGQVAVPYLSAAFGWRSVFYLLMVATSLTVVNILPIVVAEVKDVVRSRQR